MSCLTKEEKLECLKCCRMMCREKAYSSLTRNDCPWSAQLMMCCVAGLDTMAYSLLMNGDTAGVRPAC